jgi:NodT family efflux transporter outer membrane factor (OMF) lipoprotein
MKPHFISTFPLRTTLSAVSAAVLLSACASYQGITSSATPTGGIKLGQPQAVAQSRDAWPQDNWWTAYGDSQLNRLIEHALTQSPNLANAQARIARAQAAAGVAKSAEGVQVNAAVDASYGRESENSLIPPPPFGPGGKYIGQATAGVNFGYDLDFWGKNAALIRSADAQSRAAIYDRDAARLALTTSIARAYAQLAAQYELLDILEATLKQRQAIRELTEQRVASGLDTRVELKQSETGEMSLRTDIAQLKTSIEVSRLQLAALAGDMPEAARNIVRPTMTAADFTIPHDLPVDLLARRPELAAQRARIEAALGEKDAAKAQFYPSLNLTALVGFQSIGIGQLLAHGSFMNSIGSSFRLPLFDAGRLRANYAMKNAEIDVAITQYNQLVVGAAQDVAEQLTRAASLSGEEESARAAETAAEEAYRLAMLRYKAGLSPYLSVLTVESQLLAQRRVIADIRARRQDLQVSLVRALGGGFRAASTAQSAALAANDTH